MQTRFWITETSGGAQRVPPCLLIRNLSFLIRRTCFPLEEPALLAITTQPLLLIPVRMQHKEAQIICARMVWLNKENPQHKALFLSTVNKSVNFEEWAQC